MSEARLLILVRRYPHPAALARRVRDGSLFTGLRRLEAHGLVFQKRGLYLLTGRGTDELATTRALNRVVARAHVVRP